MTGAGQGIGEGHAPPLRQGAAVHTSEARGRGLRIATKRPRPGFREEGARAELGLEIRAVGAHLPQRGQRVQGVRKQRRHAQTACDASRDAPLRLAQQVLGQRDAIHRLLSLAGQPRARVQGIGVVTARFEARGPRVLHACGVIGGELAGGHVVMQRTKRCVLGRGDRGLQARVEVGRRIVSPGAERCEGQRPHHQPDHERARSAHVRLLYLPKVNDTRCTTRATVVSWTSSGPSDAFKLSSTRASRGVSR